MDTATTKSTIPRIFQITNRRLAANNGLRTRPSTIHGAADPDCHVPDSGRESKQSRQNTPGIEPEEKLPPAQRHDCIAATNRRSAPRMKYRNGVHPKYAARNSDKGIAKAEENRQRRRTRVSNKCPLSAKEKNEAKPECERRDND